MKKKIKEKFTLIVIAAAVLLLILCIFLIRGSTRKSREMKEMESRIEELEKKHASVDSIREEVKQISRYCAYEFSYTSVMCFSDENEFMGISIPLTGNSFIATIDGKINIGIDGNEVEFAEVTDSQGRVTQLILTVPHSKILDNYTIQDTLEIYDEKNNIFNPVKVEDYQGLLIEAERQEEEKVIESDLLEKSDETVRYLLTAHFRAVYGEDVEIKYTLSDEVR